MPRTKGSKNRPKINTTNDYASQIAEKQETIASLNTEIASIQKAIEEQAEYQKTDAYIEDLAREKLGLVHEDEIIFKKK